MIDKIDRWKDGWMMMDEQTDGQTERFIFTD